MSRLQVEKESAKKQSLPPDHICSSLRTKKHSNHQKVYRIRIEEIQSPREIRNYVKCQMMYFYKKRNSRPPDYSEKRCQLAKVLYCAELLSLNDKVGVVINYDESSFDCSIKKYYSWLPIGQSWHIINDQLKGQASLILIIWNAGEWCNHRNEYDKLGQILIFFKTAIHSNQQASWGCSKFSYYWYHPSSWQIVLDSG